MADLQAIKCTHCGGNMDGARKISDIELECPYCNNVFQQSGLDTLSKLI